MLDNEIIDKWLLKADYEDFINKYNLKDDNGRQLTVKKLFKERLPNGYKSISRRKMIGGNQNTYYKIETDLQKM